jgi:hypothetical protein
MILLIKTNYSCRLLGILAFARFIMVLGPPARKDLVHAVRIKKGNLAAKDGLLKLVDEMLNNVS